MDLNVQYRKDYRSLAVITIVCSMNSSKVIFEFGFDLDKGIVASTTGATSVMVKFVKVTSPVHKRCLSYGLHLATCDVLNNEKYQDILTWSDNKVDEKSDEEDYSSPPVYVKMLM